MFPTLASSFSYMTKYTDTWIIPLNSVNLAQALTSFKCHHFPLTLVTPLTMHWRHCMVFHKFKLKLLLSELFRFCTNWPPSQINQTLLVKPCCPLCFWEADLLCIFLPCLLWQIIRVHHFFLKAFFDVPIF